ncbi:hypothetical protein [Streptomyces longwoodensis]|uniref:hypothetical protein n=1 Tax=Streptomyces longwoodensis TaxID=68231 RepID=UPI0030DF906D
MLYNFLTVDHLSVTRVCDVLASAIEVPSASVDVADADGDQEERDWGALVLCDWAARRGDVSVSLDVFVQDAVAAPPTEPQCAVAVARVAETVVLYPAEEARPSAYWLATPEGMVTRARLLASDDSPPVYSIDAVETAVPQLPGVHVTLLPEIIREQPVLTPVTRDFTAAVQALHGEAEQAQVWLEEWERHVRRISRLLAGRCPPELHQEALRARNELALLTDELPPPVCGLLRAAVRTLDEEYTALTGISRIS